VRRSFSAGRRLLLWVILLNSLLLPAHNYRGSPSSSQHGPYFVSLLSGDPNWWVCSVSVSFLPATVHQYVFQQANGTFVRDQSDTQGSAAKGEVVILRKHTHTASAITLASTTQAYRWTEEQCDNSNGKGEEFPAELFAKWYKVNDFSCGVYFFEAR